MTDTRSPSSAGYPEDGTFADLLVWHLYVWGTRPHGTPTKRGENLWTKEEFINNIFSTPKFEEELATAEKGYRNWTGEWRKSAPGPAYASRISSALFGLNPQFKAWAADLEKARGDFPGKGNNVRTIDLAAALAAVGAVTPAGTNLPRLTPYFRGRDVEVEAIAQRLTAEPNDHSAILIQGGPGIGKTELTKAVAHHISVAERFRERRFFVPLETATSAQAMRDAIIRAIGCDPQHGFQAAIETLGDKPSLLVLDSFATPQFQVDKYQSLALVFENLRENTFLSLLASARGTELLDCTNLDVHRLERLFWKESYALFVSIAGDWVEADAYFKQLLNALDGLPIAIRLMALRARDRDNLRPLLEEIRLRGSDVILDVDKNPERASSLSLSIELSLNSPILNEHAMSLFRMLGALPDGLAVGDARAILGDYGRGAIDRLCQSGLATEHQGRLSLLNLIREYAVRKCPIKQSEVVRCSMHFLRILPFKMAQIEPKYEQDLSEIQSDFNNFIFAFRGALDNNLLGLACAAIAQSKPFVYATVWDTKIFDEILNRIHEEFPNAWETEPHHSALATCAFAIGYRDSIHYTC